MRKQLALVLALLLCLPAFQGCRTKVNSTDPAVVQAVAVRDAEQTVKTIEDGLTAANNTIESLQASEPDYYKHVKPLIQKISALNATASSKLAIVAQGGSADWKASMIAVGKSVTPSDLVKFGFKNPNSQAIAQAGFNLLITTLTTLEAKYQ